jgi:hypothetical protein
MESDWRVSVVEPEIALQTVHFGYGGPTLHSDSIQVLLSILCSSYGIFHGSDGQ